MSEPKSSDTKPSMPAQPKTTQLPAVPEWAIELSRSVKDGFCRVDSRLESIETNQDIQGDTVRDLGKRLTAHEERVARIEERQNAGSIRVRSTSENDMRQDAAIGVIVADVNTLKGDVAMARKELAVVATKTDAQTVLLRELVDGTKALLKNPKFIALCAAGYSALMYWLGHHHGGLP